MKSSIDAYIQTVISALTNLSAYEIEQVALKLIEARERGNTIYVFGNGGSGSTASHLVCDINKGCSYGKQKKFKTVCLNDNMATVLAYANDVSYDDVFVEQLKNFLQPNDVVIAISGSGNSTNIIKAIEYANTVNQVTTIGFTGFSGGKLKQIATLSVNASYNCMQVSEDVHSVVMHTLYKILDKY